MQLLMITVLMVMRVVGGDTEYKGRVEVCDGGVWGVHVPVFGTVMRLKLYAGN